MFKYTLAVFVLNMILLVAFIATAVIPYSGDIINHIELVVNTGINLELKLILKPIGMMFLWLIVTGIIEVAVLFGVIMPMASSELKRGW